jgi:hypothetical protein
VTIGAFLTQPAFMRLILLMAIDAERRRLAIGLGGFMAPLAALGPVRSLESEIGEAVIEGFAVERRDLRFASLMFGVAMFAFRIDDLRPAPVKTLPPLFVGRDLFMAVHAEFALRALRKGLMAIAAILFVFCVALNERARHDEPFEQVLRLD